MPIEKSNSILPETLSLPSTDLGHPVQVDLYWPPGFRPGLRDKTQAAGELSLLLINDGQDLEKMGLAGILGRLYRQQELAPLLCAGIYTGQQRKMEYGTAGFPDYRGRGAMAAKYSRFILEELLPRLEGKSVFRERAFCGFSLGALSAMDIVWNHPRTFSRAGLFSGAFWWRTKDKDDPAYRDETDRIMHARIREGGYHPGLKFFFECGTEDEEEDRNHNGVIDSIDDTLDLIGELKEKGYQTGRDIHYLQIEGGRHDVPTWALAMPQFLRWGFGSRPA